MLCGHLAMAPLLPKLRGQFAEFLNNISLARLRLFASPTCVGLQYGYLYHLIMTFLVSVIRLLRYFIFHSPLRDGFFLLSA